MYRLLKQSRTTNHIILYSLLLHLLFSFQFLLLLFFTFQQAQEFGCLLVVYFAAQIYNQY